VVVILLLQLILQMGLLKIKSWIQVFQLVHSLFYPIISNGVALKLAANILHGFWSLQQLIGEVTFTRFHRCASIKTNEQMAGVQQGLHLSFKSSILIYF